MTFSSPSWRDLRSPLHPVVHSSAGLQHGRGMAARMRPIVKAMNCQPDLGGSCGPYGGGAAPAATNLHISHQEHAWWEPSRRGLSSPIHAQNRKFTFPVDPSPNPCRSCGDDMPVGTSGATACMQAGLQLEHSCAVKLLRHVSSHTTHVALPHSRRRPRPTAPRAANQTQKHRRGINRKTGHATHWHAEHDSKWS